MANKQLYVERTDKGDYTVRHGGGSILTTRQTQAEAIEAAKRIDPNAHVNVERVRNTDVGKRDKWRDP